MWSAEQNIIKFLLFLLITGHKLLYLPAICVFFWKWWLFIQGWGIKTKTTDTCTIYPPLWILWLFLLINNCYCSSSLLNLCSDMETFLRCIIVIISVSLKCFYICGLNEQNNKNLAAVPISINYFARVITNLTTERNSDNRVPPIINSKEEKVLFTRNLLHALLPGFYFGLARQK